MAAAAPQTPELDSPRLRLGLLGPADAARVLAYFERNRAHHGPWDPPRPEGFYTLAYWHDVLGKTGQDLLDERAYRFWITELADPTGLVRGTVHFSRIARGPFQCAGLGYSLDEAVVGRGYMQEALTRAIAWAFDERRLHRLEANYRPENAPPGRVPAALGFYTEGYARRYLLIDGEWCDHVLTSLTRPAT